MTQEALKLAIQLRDTASGYWTENEIPIIEKLIELLAKPEQETVGYWKEHAQGMQRDYESLLADYEKLIQPEQEPVKYSDYEPDGVHHNKPEQKPVAWMHPDEYKTYFTTDPSEDLLSNSYWTPLYTTPPQRKPLTHEQRFDLLTKFEPYKNKWEALAILIDMVEAAHGITGEKK